MRVDAENKLLLAQFTKLPTTASLGDVAVIDPSRISSSIIELTGVGSIFGKVSPKPTGAVVSVYPDNVDACNRPGYKRLTKLTLNDNGPKEAYFTVNFGDGSPTVNVSSYGHWENGSAFAPDFFHQYAAPASGTIDYHMTITAHYNNGTQTAYGEETVTVVAQAGCAVVFKDSDWQYTHIPNTNRYIGGRLYMQNIGSDKKKQLRVVAYSKLVAENSDGSFSGVKGEMYLELACDVKNTSCATWESLVGSGWDANDKNQTLHRTAPHLNGMSDPYWSIAKSRHGYKSNGTWYWTWITLYPCD